MLFGESSSQCLLPCYLSVQPYDDIGKTYILFQTLGSTSLYPFGLATLTSIPSRGMVTMISLMMLLVSPTHAIFLPFKLANGSIDLTDCNSSACVVESDVGGREGGL